MQGQSTKSNDDLCKPQRIKGIGLRSMDDQMNKQSFQPRLTLQLGF